MNAQCQAAIPSGNGWSSTCAALAAEGDIFCEQHGGRHNGSVRPAVRAAIAQFKCFCLSCNKFYAALTAQDPCPIHNQPPFGALPLKPSDVKTVIRVPRTRATTLVIPPPVSSPSLPDNICVAITKYGARCGQYRWKHSPSFCYNHSPKPHREPAEFVDDGKPMPSHWEPLPEMCSTLNGIHSLPFDLPCIPFHEMQLIGVQADD